MCLPAASHKLLSSILCPPHLHWLTWIIVGIKFYFLCPKDNANVNGKFPPKVWKDRVWDSENFTRMMGIPFAWGSPTELHLLRSGEGGWWLEPWAWWIFIAHFPVNTSLFPEAIFRLPGLCLAQTWGAPKTDEEAIITASATGKGTVQVQGL